MTSRSNFLAQHTGTLTDSSEDEVQDTHSRFHAPKTTVPHTNTFLQSQEQTNKRKDEDDPEPSSKRRKNLGSIAPPRNTFSQSQEQTNKRKHEDDPEPSSKRRKNLGSIEFSKSSVDDEPEIQYSNRIQFSKKVEAPKPSTGYGVGEKILKQFGYNLGEGLGKSGQGRAEPISESIQHGRRGLGFVPLSQGKPYEGTEWDPTEETTNIKEIPEWLDSNPLDLDRDTLDGWKVLGKQKLVINDENNFCDPKILEDILSLKTVFDDIKPDMLHTLVSRCNLYETIKNVFFINRAALKMANMDYTFDFMFTNPETENRQPAVRSDELLYFADVCAGPGGFTEYVLWRKKWQAKGFGFTLKGQSDFNLTGMRAASTESFYPYYGVNEDGDIFNPDNLESLKKYVLSQTEDKGVHFLMADGGFSVEGEENIQEIKSKQLYLCQCIAALSLVREGGHFVVKLFDIFTKFSIGLIYLMYQNFKKICIHKPVTSRPANSERYLICKWKRNNLGTIERHLLEINRTLCEFTENKSTTDIVELVPMEVLVNDRNFFDYICKSNNSIGRSQIMSLLKIKALNNDRTLLDNLTYEGLSHEDKKADIRSKCLQLWKIPDEPKKKDEYKRISSYRDQITIITRNMNEHMNRNVNEHTSTNECITEKHLMDVFQYQPKVVKSETDLFVNKSADDPPRSFIQSPYDWYFLFCNSMKESKLHFYLSLGGYHVYVLEGKYWRSFNSISLPEGTLFLAETVEEKRGTARGIHSTTSLHVVDAFRLGHEHIFNLSLKQRNQKIKLFCEAINKPANKNSDARVIPIRSKNIYKLTEIQNELNKLTERTLKNSQRAMTTPVPNLKENNDSYFVVEGLMFIKFPKDPWIMALSKSSNYIYMFNTKNNTSLRDVVPGSFNYTQDSCLSSFKCPFYRDFLYYNFLLKDNLRK